MDTKAFPTVEQAAHLTELPNVTINLSGTDVCCEVKPRCWTPPSSRALLRCMKAGQANSVDSGEADSALKLKAALIGHIGQRKEPQFVLVFSGTTARAKRDEDRLKARYRCDCLKIEGRAFRYG